MSCVRLPGYRQDVPEVTRIPGTRTGGDHGIAALRARINGLEVALAVRDEELRLLRSQAPHEVDLQRLFPRLSLKEARMLACFVQRGRVSRDAMTTWMYGLAIDPAEPKVHDIRLCRLRKVLPSWAQIETVFGWGWEMAPAARARIVAMIERAR